MSVKFRRIMWLQPDISLQMFVSQVKGLEMLGTSVLPIDYRDDVLKLGISRARIKILEGIDSFNPDLVMVSFFSNNYELSPEFLKKIPPKAPLVVLAGDDEIYGTWQTIYFTQSANAVMTCDFAGQTLYEQLSIPAVYFFFPSLDFMATLQVEEKTIDVSFVGNCEKADRSNYINFLRENGINVATFGRGSENQFVSRNEYLNIISKSKVNLNFTKTDVHPEILNKEPWRANIRQLKARALEISKMKSFCLSEFSEDIRRVFAIGSEIDVFYDKEELLSKVKFYLKNNEKREKMASLAFDRVKRDYDNLQYLCDRYNLLYEKLHNSNGKVKNRPIFRSRDFNASEVKGNFFIFLTLLRLRRFSLAFGVVPYFLRFDLSCLIGLWNGVTELVSGIISKSKMRK